MSPSSLRSGISVAARALGAGRRGRLHSARRRLRTRRKLPHGAGSGCPGRTGCRGQAGAAFQHDRGRRAAGLFFPNFQPFIGHDAKGWSGWDYDYLAAFAAQYEGLKLVPVESTPFAGIWKLPGAEIPTCDIAAAGISDLPARRTDTGANGTWSAHYYKVMRAFAVKKGDQLASLDDMKGKKVIVTKGSTADLDLQNRISCAPAPLQPAVDLDESGRRR